MSTNTILGVVLIVVLLASAAAVSLPLLHAALGAVAFVLAVAYAYTGRRLRLALALGILLAVLTGLGGATGLALLNQAEETVAAVHLFGGLATLLVALVGVILVWRAASKA
jgi:hypothetical protein